MQCARIDYEILAVDLSVWREPLVLLLAILRFFARSIMRVSLHVRLLARFSLVRFSLVRFLVVRLSLVRKLNHAYQPPPPLSPQSSSLPTHYNRSPPLPILPTVQQFPGQLLVAPPRSKLATGAARLHVQDLRVSLVMGAPPRLAATWAIADLRYGGSFHGHNSQV